MRTTLVNRLLRIEASLATEPTRTRFGFEVCCKLADRIEPKLNKLIDRTLNSRV